MSDVVKQINQELSALCQKYGIQLVAVIEESVETPGWFRPVVKIVGLEKADPTAATEE